MAGAAWASAAIAVGNSRRALRALETPFLVPAEEGEGRRPLRWAERDGYHFLDITLKNVGDQPALLGDIQLRLDNANLICCSEAQALVQPKEVMTTRVQSTERVRSHSARSGAELCIYYTPPDGMRLMTRSDANLVFGGVACTSFTRSRSDRCERPRYGWHTARALQTGRLRRVTNFLRTSTHGQ